MGTEYSSNHADLLDPEFQEIFEQNWALPQEWSQFFHSDETRVKSPKYSSIAGIGAVSEVPEGQNIPTSRIIDGFDITATHHWYGVGVDIHDDLIHHDLFNKIREGYHFVSRAMIDATETKIADILNGAFTGARVGGDGLNLCSTSHLREDGGAVLPNRAATDADFDIAAYRAAKLQFMDQRDGNGRRIASWFPTKLIVPQAEIMNVAKEILSSPDRSDTTNRATNILQNDVAIAVYRYLTDTDAWFLTNDQHKMFCLWTKRPDKKTDYDIKARVTTSNSRMGFALFFKDWRGVWGSTGA